MDGALADNKKDGVVAAPDRVVRQSVNRVISRGRRSGEKDPPAPRPEETEEERLARELAETDDDSDVPGLKDTAVQRIEPLLKLWNETDDRRAMIRRRAEIDRKVGDKEAAKKGLTELQEKVMPRLAAILRQLVDELAKDERDTRDLRESVGNWLQVRGNLRPILKKHLKARGVDIGTVIERAEELETEQRRLAAAMESVEA